MSNLTKDSGCVRISAQEGGLIMYQEYQVYNYNRLCEVTELINQRLVAEREANKSVLYRLFVASRAKQAKTASKEDLLLIEYPVRSIVHNFLCDPSSVSEVDVMLANQYSYYMNEPLFRAILSDMNARSAKEKRQTR